MKNYIQTLKEKYGKFFGMVYCAGVANIMPTKSLDYKSMRADFDINYFIPILMIKEIAKRANNANKDTSIVIISALSSIMPLNGMLAYSGAKAALNASCKAISKEYSNVGVRINTILPSDINTPMSENMAFFVKNRTHLYPFGFGNPNDVAHMAIFLLSNKSAFISGQNYIVDSGEMS
ncbi:SDR family oxidoreductase [Helicobacter sp. 16-1353]|uniref:SDR family NAD(P)-dependent oxidoreductase n=1 Tax=Helicobacter sp. 16-1353 TaxID=2004996 RepID=UPI0015EF3E1E|nr:SDR family oxidoreductase [Helicobacter sp. 16-1353]